jgi:pre-rRNA-processing protein TSR4
MSVYMFLITVSSDISMPPRVEDDWSDSDDDGSVSEVETSVLLGVPDGDIQDTSDLSDPSVSHIGGLPVCHV